MNDFEKRKSRLLRIEKHLRKAIETDSSDMEKTILKAAGIGAVVGGALFLGYSLYKIFSGDSVEEDNEEERLKSKASSNSFAKTRIASLLTAIALKALRKEITEIKNELQKNEA